MQKDGKTSFISLKRWCINIPKNLIRIAIVVVICSFVYITYILMNDQLLDEFLRKSNDGDRHFENQLFVHPFFQFLQQEYDPSARFKEQYEGKWDDNQMFKVPQAKLESLSTKKFYRYFLTQNAPLHIVDGCQQWPALSLWNDDYLS